MSDRSKLGSFLKEVIHWRWDEFVRAEKDPKYSGLEGVVLSLVRTTSEAKLGSIKLAIDRVDGKLETPMEVIYPKVFFLYPFAESVALPAGEQPPAALPDPTPSTDLIISEPPQAEEGEEPVQLATLSLRETLNKMADSPRQVVPLILKKKEEVETILRDEPEAEINDSPMVKSVIAANLMYLATDKHNFDAITEVFDQIDGKLVETIRVLGDDIFLTQYTEIAPYGAKKNGDGVYCLEQPLITDVWKQKLKKD